LVSRMTDTMEVLQDFDGGVFLEKLNRALTEVAGGVIDYKVKGRVTITLEMQPIGGSAQVNLTHKLEYLVPMPNGSLLDKDNTSTVMQVHTGGRLCFEKENQTALFNRNGSIKDATDDK